MLDQPLASVLSARFLVRHESEHQITRRYDAFRLELSGEGQDHPDHVLHVHGAAPPDVTVLDGAGKGMDAPVGGSAGTTVEVTVKHQRTTTRLGSLQASKGHFLGRVLRTRRIPSRNRLLEACAATHSAHARSPWWFRVLPCSRCAKRMRGTDQFDYFCFGSARIRIIRGVVIPLSYHRINDGGDGMPHNLAIWGSSPNRILFPSTEKSGPSPSGGNGQTR